MNSDRKKSKSLDLVNNFFSIARYDNSKLAIEIFDHPVQS
jgi:hypothetical protein